MQEALVVRREQHIAAHVLSRLCMSVALVRSFWQPVFRTTLVLGGAQPPRARALARKRKATEVERRARKPTTTRCGARAVPVLQQSAVRGFPEI